MLKRGSLRVVIIVLAFFPVLWCLLQIHSCNLKVPRWWVGEEVGAWSVTPHHMAQGNCCLMWQGEVQPFKNHGYQSNLYLFPFCHFSCFSSETSDVLISYWIGAEMAQFCRVQQVVSICWKPQVFLGLGLRVCLWKRSPVKPPTPFRQCLVGVFPLIHSQF